MHVLERLAFAGACVIALAAASWPTRLPPPAAGGTRPYQLIDQRDPKSLKSGFESLMITNCAYGIERVGDHDIDPPLAVFLDAMLASRFGDELAGRTILLRGFSVHLNNSLALRKGVSDMYGPGLVDTLLNKRKVGCAPEDLLGGYTVGEVQPGMAPVVAAVEIEIDGKRYFGRGIAESGRPFPPKKKAPQAEKDAWNAMVAKVVDAALLQLGDRLAAGLSEGAGASPAPGAATATGSPPDAGR
jgi:hypothetical protein